jgi:hypothetical protein
MSFDVKIGYNRRAAAKVDQTIVLQDVEGRELTDEAGAQLITTEEGFLTSELTSSKALSVGLPTQKRELNFFYTILFGESFIVRRQDPDVGGDPTVKVIAPEGAYKYIRVGSRIEIATGVPINELNPDNPSTTRVDGNSFETFVIQSVTEIQPTQSTTGKLEVRYTLNAAPSFERNITYIRRVIIKERTGILKIEEQFKTTSEVSTSLLGIDRAEEQLGLFSNVSTYGLNTDDFVFYNDNPPTGPTEWSNRYTEAGYRHEPAGVEHIKNEGALRVVSFPVPYTYPYTPLTQDIGPDGVDRGGLYSPEGWRRWQNWLALGKGLYYYYLSRRDAQIFSDEFNSNYQKYNRFLTRFIAAINIYDDNENFAGRNFNNSTQNYYTQVSIWTDTWHSIVDGTSLRDPVSGAFISFATLSELGGSNQFLLRGTGTDATLGAGSVETESGVPTNPQDPLFGKVILNPYQESWLNRTWISADPGGAPSIEDFRPGYETTGGQFALLQSRQAFRYQPGRISGYTFGTRAIMDKTEGQNYAEWGIFNDFDEYVFRREGANFYIVRRSTIHYEDGPGSFLSELGLTDEFGNEDPNSVTYYNKEIGGKIYQFQEVKLGKEKFNGDTLDGNGPSGYLLNTDQITMYKIEFGWYGAIGLRLYAYIPVDNGEARWVIVHTFVIENKLNVPSMGDPFFKFKYEMRIGAGQAPDLTQPQVLYKYGTSMYIDGGDEGTVSVYSQTSDDKLLPSNGNSVTLFGIYPKSFITSGDGTQIPNKKIIIPRQISITSNGFVELNVVRCTACKGSGFLYLPNASAGTNGDIRKMNKVDGLSNTLTLSKIVLIITSNPSNTKIRVSEDGISFLRAGDYLLDNIDGTTVNGVSSGGGVIKTITNVGTNLYEIEFTAQSFTSTLSAGQLLQFQPRFVLESDRLSVGLPYSDEFSKVIASRIWDTYLGKEVTGTKQETINLLQYVYSDFHNLEYDRDLDPEKITVSTTDLNPAYFFGSTGSFDVRLSQLNNVIASPNAINGPTSSINWLNPYNYESTGQVADFAIGFTPNKPLFNVSGELTGWEKPDGTILTETLNGVTSNVTMLPKNEMVYLEQHPYARDVTLEGVESGEGWRDRITPFTQDFRIANPAGSYTGRCSEAILTKNDPTEVACNQVTSNSLSNISFSSWQGFETVNEKNQYLASSSIFITSLTPIISGVGDPTGGQTAIKIGSNYVKDFYTSGGVLYNIRFNTQQKSYRSVVNGEQVTVYVIGVNDSFTSARDSQGNLLITTSEFLVAYNSVRLRAWFNGDYYDVPNSYTTGPGSDGIFEFDAFPLYPVVLLRDAAQIRGAQVTDIDPIGNVKAFNPQWKVNYKDGEPRVQYDAGQNNETGEINANGVGNKNETPQGVDSLIPSAFQQADRLSSSQIDRQGDSLLRPGSTLTTLYINNQTKTFDLRDIFNFDRKVITPDIVNTEAIYFVARVLDNSPNVSIQSNITYVEQL